MVEIIFTKLPNDQEDCFCGRVGWIENTSPKHQEYEIEMDRGAFGTIKVHLSYENFVVRNTNGTTPER
jgi:hypothetical protein